MNTIKKESSGSELIATQIHPMPFYHGKGMCRPRIRENRLDFVAISQRSHLTFHAKQRLAERFNAAQHEVKYFTDVAMASVEFYRCDQYGLDYHLLYIQGQLMILCCEPIRRFITSIWTRDIFEKKYGRIPGEAIKKAKANYNLIAALSDSSENSSGPSVRVKTKTSEKGVAVAGIEFEIGHLPVRVKTEFEACELSSLDGYLYTRSFHISILSMIREYFLRIDEIDTITLEHEGSTLAVSMSNVLKAGGGLFWGVCGRNCRF